jgi:hypothetical protein
MLDDQLAEGLEAYALRQGSIMDTRALQMEAGGPTYHPSRNLKRQHRSITDDVLIPTADVDVIEREAAEDEVERLQMQVMSVLPEED